MYPPHSRQRQQADPDAAVRQTDLDASQSRLSAVKKQYMNDPFIQYFVPRAQYVQSRPPLINLGTFVRSEAIDRLINRWLEIGDGKKQILSLGSGSDTRFWRLSSGSLKSRIAKFLEVDFAEITSKKAMAIKKNQALSSLLCDDPNEIKVTGGGTGLTSPVYSLQPVDLRHPPADIFIPLIQAGLLDTSLPTLFLAECVFVYLSPSVSKGLIEYASTTFQEAGCAGLVYEMFGLSSSFGRVMRGNLRERGIEIPGAIEENALESQTRRFEECGMENAKALTLRTIRRDYIDVDELTRLAQLEMLDEIEELDLMLSHYVISWAVKPPSTANQETEKEWDNWSLQRKADETHVN